MSKRLFALLLAAALVLSMGAAPALSGQMSGTEQAEQGADASVPAPDAADAAGDGAPADEAGEDGAPANEAGETDGPGVDDGAAYEPGEDDGDDGETVPAADNDMPDHDDPQTAADEPAAVSVLFEGAEHIVSLTADGADVLSDAQAGTPIVLSADSESRVRLGMELEEGYTAEADENAPDSVRFDGGAVEIQDDGDGIAVVRIAARPQVMAVSAPKLTVIFQGADLIESVTNADDSTVCDLSGPVVFDTDSVALQITVKDGYYVQETDECDLDRYYRPAGKQDNVEAFLLRDKNSDGTVTVSILKLITVKLVDAGGYVTMVSDSIGIYRKNHSDFLTSRSYGLYQDGRLELEASPCALDVKGGHVSEKYYRVNSATGALSVNYDVKPDGSETMTITTRVDDEAPTRIKIEYAGEIGGITSRDDYVLPGRSFSVELKEGYTISVEGSAFVEAGYSVRVNEDATFVTVTVKAVWKDATLSATIPDALESTDLYEKSGDIGRDYVVSGGAMKDGKGWFMLKNGYAVGAGVTGGSVLYYKTIYDEEVYTCYIVDATADTVNVPIEKVQPCLWVDVKVYNAVRCHYAITSVLPTGYVSGWSTQLEEEDSLLVSDELTAKIDPGYELEAVSGCTLRWEKDADGQVIYRILPDDGGTSVEVRIIEAGQQLPVLKAATDADADVQTDGAAESKLKSAIGGAVDALAGGSIPAGMSQETAGKLSAALKEADAVTVPEVSAVLSVKKAADTAAVPGAAAVYEIGIVIRVNGQEVGSLTELTQPISIGLPLPPVTGRIVYVVRVHDGEREKLPAAVQDGAIRFATDRFSEFAIMSSNDLADAVIDPIPDQTWTGSEVTPKVHVTITGPNGQETLEKGADYELAYRDNVSVGTAAVTITGKGDFAGTSATVTFRIVKAKAGAAASDGTAPATGDETPLALYAGLLALGVSGLAAVLLRRKKQQ